MITANKELTMTKDIAAKKIHIAREFDAPVESVWQAWTSSDLLDEWWAPRPWKTETVSMDFREGGRWRYDMVGPDNARHHCFIDYQTIVPEKQFSGIDGFCDQNGKPSDLLPSMNWKVTFVEASGITRVNVEITFAQITDMETILQMGFKEGFTSALGNLDELLAAGLHK
jgi:uncharacterized protein YndB with AHSA1/START domain